MKDSRNIKKTSKVVKYESFKILFSFNLYIYLWFEESHWNSEQNTLDKYITTEIKLIEFILFRESIWRVAICIRI